MPTCPRGHDDSRVVFDGHYGAPGHRRQRYRCVPGDGSKWHRFTPPLPRQDTTTGDCEHCERSVHTHEGPQTPRESLFSARDVAVGLVEVGRGVSYRAASATVRLRAGRMPLGQDGEQRYTRHGQLVADFVEVFAPIVFEPYRRWEWPTDTLVLDSSPFRVRDFLPDGRPRAGGKVAFNVFGALGYDERGRGLLWRLQAFPTAAGDDWEAFLCALDGSPRRVVCDAHDGIRVAVEQAFPDAEISLCEWHLREKLRLRLVRAGANTNADRVWRRHEAAPHSLHGWEQFCAAAWRHRPVLGEVRRWVERWDERVRAQLARRPSAWQREHGRVVTNAGLERKLAHVEEWLEPRRNALRNRERLNRLLMLMQLHLNDEANETRYAGHVRDWLEANGGRATERRLLIDPAGLPSLPAA